jgi:predicted membrane chloride channel (bestrophin family)
MCLIYFCSNAFATLLRRAAVRFWDARQAIGGVIHLIRTNIATAGTGLMSPIRLKRAAIRQQRARVTIDEETDLKKEEKQEEEDIMKENASIKLLSEYACWMAAITVSVSHFLRQGKRPGWRDEEIYTKKFMELDPLLDANDVRKVLMSYDDQDGNPTFDANGMRVRDPPLVVLNRMHELAFDIAYFRYSSGGLTAFNPTPEAQAALYTAMTENINAITGAFGTMERIKNTPLPFVYTVHLRTFMFLYLLLWNLTSVAAHGWMAIPILFLVNLLLLGIEAAAVECESPFDWGSNHIPLGKISVVVAYNIVEALKEIRW